jgi:hypothetical protein
MLSTVTLRDISPRHLPAPVPYPILAPSQQEALPLCILLVSAGGTRDSLLDLQPLFDRWWAESTVPPMIIATPTPGFDYYTRNRLHHSAGLIGPTRDASLWESNIPANRARRNAQHLRDFGLAINLEAGDRDFLNAHDGTEFLHRVLWDLDLSHEYRLAHGATATNAFIRFLRAGFEPLRAKAAQSDPATNRSFGHF